MDICLNTPSVPPVVRVSDTNGAAEFLNEQPYVQAKNIGVIGFSHGGWTIMRLVQENSFAKGYGIKGAVAYYPLCDLQQHTQIAIPTLVLIGELDTGTPAFRCRDLSRFLKRPQLFDLIVYPNAYHSFDVDMLPQNVQGMGVGRVIAFRRYERDPEADVDSQQRTKAFFADLLK